MFFCCQQTCPVYGILIPEVSSPWATTSSYDYEALWKRRAAEILSAQPLAEEGCNEALVGAGQTGFHLQLPALRYPAA